MECLLSYKCKVRPATDKGKIDVPVYILSPSRVNVKVEYLMSYAMSGLLQTRVELMYPYTYYLLVV